MLDVKKQRSWFVYLCWMHRHLLKKIKFFRCVSLNFNKLTFVFIHITEENISSLPSLLWQHISSQLVIRKSKNIAWYKIRLKWRAVWQFYQRSSAFYVGRGKLIVEIVFRSFVQNESVTDIYLACSLAPLLGIRWIQSLSVSWCFGRMQSHHNKKRNKQCFRISTKKQPPERYWGAPLSTCL